MERLDDAALRRLQEAAEAPDLSGTRYRLLQRIGRGGMGSVFLAEDTELGRTVALKVLRAAGSPVDLARRLRREARVLASLEHPGIVPVHDVGTLTDGRVFYTMKHVRGQRLDGHARGTAELNARLRVFVRVCETVASAHARGILHRDLKPANVMVGEFGEVLVMDWGLAKVLADVNGRTPAGARASGDPDSGAGFEPATHALPAPRVTAVPMDAAPDREPPGTGSAPVGAETGGTTRGTAPGTVLGTPGYMSPEQGRGEVEQLGPATDVYSLGAMLFFLTTLADPAPAAPLRPLDPRRQDQRVNKRLAAICRKATDPDPPRRYASAADVGADVSRWLEHAPVAAYPEGILERGLRFARRYDFVIFLILAYMVMRALIAFRATF